MSSSSPQSQQYEIEIKSLLGTVDKAEALKRQLKKQFPKIKQTEKSKQLNHYFVGGDMNVLYQKVSPFISEEQQAKFKLIAEKGKNFSVRTRQQNETVLLVIKAAIDDTTSSNGISRMEFEAKTPKLTLEQLDQLLIDSGLQYQAKWSREREAYQADNVTVCIDKNAGYGYLAEFESVVSDPTQVESTKSQLRQVMEQLGAEELQQDRLERMFAFYNAHWPEYYGTDNVFVVE